MPLHPSIDTLTHSPISAPRNSLTFYLLLFQITFYTPLALLYLIVFGLTHMPGKSYATLISDLFTKGLLFRGIVPGLMRSSIANGCSMVAYKKVESLLKEMREEK